MVATESTKKFISTGAPGGATSLEKTKSNKTASRYISAEARKLVWMRDQGKCTYTNPITHKKCDSTHLIQFEHILPFAKGGAHTLENLTLHCANHNQLKMKEEFVGIKTNYKQLF